MQTLAYVLGAIEVVLVPVSLLGLLWALVRRSQRTRRWAVPVALGLALTVAQPFGIVAKRVPGAPAGSETVRAAGVHVARVGGVVPILPFILYRQEILGPIGDESPSAKLKARSWFWLPILTNATTIKDICASDIRVPCWGKTPNSTAGPSNALTLAEKDGRYYVTLHSPQAARYLAPTSYTWELAPGIASTAGLIYWALIAVLVPAALAIARATKAERGDLRVPV